MTPRPLIFPSPVKTLDSVTFTVLWMLQFFIIKKSFPFQSLGFTLGCSFYNPPCPLSFCPIHVWCWTGAKWPWQRRRKSFRSSCTYIIPYWWCAVVQADVEAEILHSKTYVLPSSINHPPQQALTRGERFLWYIPTAALMMWWRGLQLDAAQAQCHTATQLPTVPLQSLLG